MSDNQTLNIRPPLWLPIIVAVIAGGLYVAGKFVETRDRSLATIAVTGEGRAFATPDIGEISLGIQTGRMKTAAEAMAKLKEGMNKVVDGIKKTGVEAKDITTENFSLNPIYDWTDQGQQFRGFEATQSVRVKVRNLDKVTDVLTAATNGGANQAGSVNFTVDEPEAKRAEARQKAIDQAKEKAETLAAELGMRLGDIKGFDEGGGYSPPMPMMARDAVGMAGGGGDMASLPLPSGEQEIRVNVTLTYELE